MIKLLVVDDEPIIADVMSDLFRQIENPIFDVHTAYSGKSAVEYIKENKIHILLSDICMPNVDGLEVQKAALSKWPDCKVVFLTGHDEFTYIQSAVRNNIVNYILKTEDEAVIVRSVLKGVEMIHEENQQRYLLETAQKNLTKALPYLQRDLLTSILDGWVASSEEIERNFHELKFPLDRYLPVILIIGRIDQAPQMDMPYHRIKTYFNVQDTASQVLCTKFRCMTLLYEQTRIILLIQPMEPDVSDFDLEEGHLWKGHIQVLADILELVQKKCLELFDSKCSFIVGSAPTPLRKLSETYTMLDFKLNCQFKFVQQAVIHSGHDTLLPVFINEQTSEKVLRKQIKRISELAALLECGQSERFDDVFSEIVGCISDLHHNKLWYKNEIYYRLAVMFLSYLNKTERINLMEELIDLEKLTRLDLTSSWEEAILFFKKLAKIIFEIDQQQESSNKQDLIHRVQKYIEDHYGEDISLTNLADMFHFNASYFSRLYKSLTNDNISTFISQVKVKRAIEMLQDETMKIHEISNALGFKTPSYFTSFFSKNLGVTPQKYRDALFFRKL